MLTRWPARAGKGRKHATTGGGVAWCTPVGDPPGAAGSGPLRQRNAAMTLPVALDTNLLVHLLTGDEPEQAGRLADLIDASPAARSSLALKA